MRFDAEISQTAALLGDPVRATMVAALLDNDALSAGELAFAARVSPQSASFHLAKLTSAAILKMERHGRNRVYRLAGSDVATAIESLAVLSSSKSPGDTHQRYFVSERQQQLRAARTCYDHLAGIAGVMLHDSILEFGYLIKSGEKEYQITDKGNQWLEKVSIDQNSSKTRRPFVHPCLDWTERRPHLAGRLAAELLRKFFNDGWIARIPDTRSVRITDQGLRGFEREFGINPGTGGFGLQRKLG